jgi:hypothetical protein
MTIGGEQVLQQLAHTMMPPTPPRAHVLLVPTPAVSVWPRSGV